MYVHSVTIDNVTQVEITQLDHVLTIFQVNLCMIVFQQYAQQILIWHLFFGELLQDIKSQNNLSLILSLCNYNLNSK